MKPRLTRSKDRIIAGVCGGLASHFSLDPSLVRIGFALIALISAGIPMLLIYVVMWFVIPEEA
jgi:phage shock protein C